MRWFTERPWIVVSIVWIGLAGMAAVWVGLDRSPPVWDYANHLERAVHCALPWYGPRAVGFPRLLVAQGFKRPVAEGAPEVLTAAGVGFYPKWFLTEFGLVAVLLLAVGTFVA